MFSYGAQKSLDFLEFRWRIPTIPAGVFTHTAPANRLWPTEHSLCGGSSSAWASLLTSGMELGIKIYIYICIYIYINVLSCDWTYALIKWSPQSREWTYPSSPTVYCIVGSPSQVKSPSVTVYPPFPQVSSRPFSHPSLQLPSPTQATTDLLSIPMDELVF